MKYISFAVSVLLGLAYIDSVEGVNVIETGKSLNKVTKSKQKGGKYMISVGLSETEYENKRYEEYMNPLSNESNLALA